MKTNLLISKVINLFVLSFLGKLILSNIYRRFTRSYGNKSMKIDHNHLNYIMKTVGCTQETATVWIPCYIWYSWLGSLPHYLFASALISIATTAWNLN